ncbi:peptide transporter, partial [Endobacter medicaginis]
HWAVAVDRRRSVSLAQLSALGGLRGVSLVSLQLGPPADQLFDPPEGMRIHDAMHEARSMDDTAALIAGLDLVISVDTSVAHLAGGMGKPVFLLDRFDNCWRWGHGSETTALYPQMRIFRQERPDAWEAPIGRLVEAVREMAESRTGPTRRTKRRR